VSPFARELSDFRSIAAGHHSSALDQRLFLEGNEKRQ